MAVLNQVNRVVPVVRRPARMEVSYGLGEVILDSTSGGTRTR